ncbi:MazG-like pyrophosphatase [Mycobacterium phage DS6A]|uniref:MazG n=1 Tax=Mycobacterium phage DS6A TaxID=45764 RepID=G8I4I0_9CAUD|nr:MazG-like pyrophosphatase [Mycobacterium phage DS6A]AER47624.1 MazG [Mycobacterium phage DS6A]
MTEHHIEDVGTVGPGVGGGGVRIDVPGPLTMTTTEARAVGSALHSAAAEADAAEAARDGAGTLDGYQQVAAETAIYPGAGYAGSWVGLSYVALGLAGEAGEIANKAKKIIRDNDGALSDDSRGALAAELGDVLWYVAQTATQLGYRLSDIADGNLAKLADRAGRGTLQGSGDTR